jgi:hypothetical protein
LTITIGRRIRFIALPAVGTKRPIRDVRYFAATGGGKQTYRGHAKIDVNDPKPTFDADRFVIAFEFNFDEVMLQWL